MKFEENIKILIVEDDEEARETLLEVLDKEEYSIEGYGTAEEGFDHISRNPVDLLITDLVLPGNMNGIELLKRVRESYPSVQVIMVTGHATVETAIDAMKKGAFDYLTKPIDISRLRDLVENAIERRLEEIQRNALARRVAEGHGYYGMFGKSDNFLSIVHRINLVAPTESNVLILGESGTGKELAADAIHKGSKRADGPFVKVNLNAIPESLIESELFGHVKGAFTGANSSRKGMFQQANGGTILLDEIGDMPFHLQAKLLRAIETKKVTPLGAEKAQTLSIRIVSSTNRKLTDMIEEGTFRQDLYFRLSVFAIRLPPLRERRDDIPLLARHFLQMINRKMGKDIEGISPEVMGQLRRYDWPGNIRQLASAIEEMVLLSQSKIIENPPEFLGTTEKPEPVFSGNDAYSLDEMEKEAIKNALEQTGMNKKKAAELLGIGLRTLYRKVKKYDLL